MRSLRRKAWHSESLSLPKNKLTTGKMIDDNFRKIAVANHLEGVDKLVEGATWEEATNKVIADNLVEKIEHLLKGKAHYFTCCDRTTEHRKIVIEYDHKQK